MVCCEPSPRRIDITQLDDDVPEGDCVADFFFALKHSPRHIHAWTRIQRKLRESERTVYSRHAETGPTDVRGMSYIAH